VGSPPAEDYRIEAMSRKQRKRNDAATMVLNLVPSVDVSIIPCVICFDGGTSNNIPSRGGYGIGYGSYLLNGEVVRLDFASPMSANEAEIRTLVAAAEAAKLIRDPARTRLCVSGDSQIALKWANKAAMKVFYRPKLGWSPGFKAAVADLYVSLRPFAELVTQWQPRERSVQIFGH
jgi:ribonuclease HI